MVNLSIFQCDISDTPETSELDDIEDNTDNRREGKEVPVDHEIIETEESREHVTVGSDREDTAADRLFIDVASLIKRPPRPPGPPSNYNKPSASPKPNINQPGNTINRLINKT